MKTISVFCFCVWLSQASILKENVEILKSPNVFVNGVKEYVSQSKNPHGGCLEQLLQYEEGLKKNELWALQMFDASAKIPSGILDGNLAELGSFNECINIQGKPSDYTIYGKYCLGQLSLDSFFTKEIFVNNTFSSKETSTNDSIMIQFGICVPSACEKEEIQEFLHFVGISINIDEDFCQTKASQPDLDVQTIIVLSFFGIVFFWAIVSTAYDVVLQHLRKAPLHYSLISFSLYTNGKKLFDTSTSPNDITCLNGIRVISTIWIILCHSFILQLPLTQKNLLFMLEFFTSRSSLYIRNATIAVDTFFVISGIIVAYVFMTYTKRGIKFNLLLFYIHRYIRLTPVLSAVILFNIFLAKHTGSGPVWHYAINTTCSTPCEQSWWRALLFIQNYGNSSTCVPQSWYLSVDMQLYIFSPLLLLPLLHWPKVALFVTGFIALCSTAAAFTITWIYNFTTAGVASNVYGYWRYYYMAMYARAVPWSIGIIVGYLIYKTKKKNCQMVINTYLALILWIIALSIMTASVFAEFDLKPAKNQLLKQSFYNALVPPAWALSIGWITFACHFGYGGVVNWFLSWKIFKMLSKLTYCLYVAHYTIIVITTADLKIAPVLTNAVLLREVWVHIMLSLFAAIVLMLGFEAPIISIEKGLLNRTKEKKLETQSAV